MKILKFLIIILVLTTFFFLINHYINLENYKVSFDNESIPIIEADNKPIKILPPPDEDINPLDESCTLNDEC
ncbi:MAG: hypothetical protein CFH28_00088 [Alphaproteobacteria bacterium MarineAlpha6_Bin6]|nr:hypothetical protein [Pelagibacteraceae bacterium]PPR32213.1 MAG: hypothetical protein CFH28_00088 [Alphaproteobacteria bacterium MarineAlpha6_Bin6]PPR33302.1 MAG: hypothetical protein CFH27_00725 [Alphaproteobacteria bacterium MarineAlpha6_Bin5]|tara:strand:- start:109 stop:324 length:216 start_codon:yes stop_codon:yes gene_type:complete